MYYKSRYYSTDLGRFISRDSLGYNGSLNLHEYVRGRVTSSTDPLGLQESESLQECLDKVQKKYADCLKKAQEELNADLEKAKAILKAAEAAYPKYTWWIPIWGHAMEGYTLSALVVYHTALDLAWTQFKNKVLACDAQKAIDEADCKEKCQPDNEGGLDLPPIPPDYA